MRTSIKLIFIAFVAIFATSCWGDSSTLKMDSNNTAINGEAKYIFYFIGDGMAATQVQLAEAALSVPEFVQNYSQLTNTSTPIEGLNIKTLGITGLATSNAKNRYITDSAAAGTALATGDKTNVGVISQSAEGETLKTIAEMAKQKGMKVGIVSSVSIDHATPACFYAHVASRSDYAKISDQLLTSGFDYFAGGTPKWDKRAEAEGVDMKSAFEAYKKRAEANGYKFATTKSEFDAVTAGEDHRIIATLDKLANKQYAGDGFAMPYTIDLARQSSEDDKISLAEFTQKGIDLMADNKEGFFMMVEGGKIDWACHANDAATAVYEVVAFDQAVGVALDFAAKHPDETLIVVTGDHDCGGLALGFAGTKYESAFDLLTNARMSNSEFSVAVKGKIEAGESFDSLLKFACEEYGFTNNITDGSEGVISMTSELSDVEIKMLQDGYNMSAKRREPTYKENYAAAYGGYDPFTTTCTNILNNKSGIEFASFSHTAVPVMVFAGGANEGLFSGYYDNTDIPKKIMAAAGLKGNY